MTEIIVETTGKYLELSGQIYVGGIERNRHARALNQGIRTANSSLRGCLRSFQLDGRLLGLREARVTRHVSADCVWDYPCIRAPCTEGARCIQRGSASFDCECPQQEPQPESCTKVEFQQSVVDREMTAGKDPAADPDAATKAFKVLNVTPVQVTQPSNHSCFFQLEFKSKK